MIAINLKINDTQLSRALLASERTEYIDALMTRIGRFGVDQIATLTPGSGILRSTWQDTYSRGAGGYINQLTIANRTTLQGQQILNFLEFGTKPHSIDARNREWMYFYWEKVNDFVFAKHVDHPGHIAYRMASLTADLINVNMSIFTTMFDVEYTRAVG